jgi:mono/diheme cytochrome c family protein
MRLIFATLGFLLVAPPAGADSYEEHDYILNCSGCHRIDGTGSRTVPSLLAMPELDGKPGARAYWIRVPGAAQAPLSDARLAALMNWLVQRFTGRQPEPEYAAEEVGRLRSNPLRDPIAKRNEIRHARSH